MQEISLGLTMFRGIKQQVLGGLGEVHVVGPVFLAVLWLWRTGYPDEEGPVDGDFPNRIKSKT